MQFAAKGDGDRPTRLSCLYTIQIFNSPHDELFVASIVLHRCFGINFSGSLQPHHAPVAWKRHSLYPTVFDLRSHSFLRDVVSTLLCTNGFKVVKGQLQNQVLCKFCRFDVECMSTETFAFRNVLYRVANFVWWSRRTWILPFACDPKRLVQCKQVWKKNFSFLLKIWQRKLTNAPTRISTVINDGGISGIRWVLPVIVLPTNLRNE